MTLKPMPWTKRTRKRWSGRRRRSEERAANVVRAPTSRSTELLLVSSALLSLSLSRSSALTLRTVPQPVPLPTLDAVQQRLKASLNALEISHSADDDVLQSFEAEVGALEQQDKELRDEVVRVNGKYEWFKAFFEWVEDVAAFLDAKVRIANFHEGDLVDREHSILDSNESNATILLTRKNASACYSHDAMPTTATMSPSSPVPPSSLASNLLFPPTAMSRLRHDQQLKVLTPKSVTIAV